MVLRNGGSIEERPFRAPASRDERGSYERYDRRATMVYMHMVVLLSK